MRMLKILVMGLPGAGKTTLATALAPLLNAVVFNADAVRANISRDLGFGHADRIDARRMGWICDWVAEAGGTVIADFVCPTEETPAAFGNAFTIWLDRISASRFEDTNRMFVPPKRFDLRVCAEGTPQYWAEQALARLRPSFDPQKPTAFFLGGCEWLYLGTQGGGGVSFLLKPRRGANGRAGAAAPFERQADEAEFPLADQRFEVAQAFDVRDVELEARLVHERVHDA